MFGTAPYSPRDWSRDAASAAARRAGRSPRHGAAPRAGGDPLLPSLPACAKFLAAAAGAIVATIAAGAAVGAVAGVLFGGWGAAWLAPALLLAAAAAEVLVRWTDADDADDDPGRRPWWAPRSGAAGPLAAAAAAAAVLPAALGALWSAVGAAVTGWRVTALARVLVWRPPLWVAAVETASLAGAAFAGAHPALVALLSHPTAWWLAPGGGGMFGSVAGLAGMVAVVATVRDDRAATLAAGDAALALPLAVALASRWGWGWLGQLVAAVLCWQAIVRTHGRAALFASIPAFLAAEAAPAGAPPSVVRILEAGSHFEVLGVDRSATDAEVKAAWRSLVREVHPDKLGAAPGANVATSRVSDAWEALKTGEGRKAHARALDGAADGAASTPATAPPSPRRDAYHHGAPDDADDGPLPVPCRCAARVHAFVPAPRAAARCPEHRAGHPVTAGDVWCERAGKRGRRATYFMVLRGTVYDISAAAACPHSPVAVMLRGRRAECVLRNRR